MARVIHLGQQIWTNYHQTAACNLRDRIELANGEEINGRAHLKGVAETVLALLKEAKRCQIPVRPIGAGWSPSPINHFRVDPPVAGLTRKGRRSPTPMMATMLSPGR